MNSGHLFQALLFSCLVMALASTAFAGPEDQPEEPAETKSESEPETETDTDESAEDDDVKDTDADKQDGPAALDPKTTRLVVTVLNADRDDTRIKGARVVVSDEAGEDHARKTDGTGTAVFPRLPHGEIKLDITSPGMRSAGGSYELEKPRRKIVFKLNRRPPPEPDQEAVPN